MRLVEFYCPRCQMKTPHLLERMITGEKVCAICRSSDLEELVDEVLNGPYILVGDYDFIEENMEKAGMHK